MNSGLIVACAVFLAVFVIIFFYNNFRSASEHVG
jgi:hypothetical protein